MPSAPLAGLTVVLVARFNRRYHRVGRALRSALESSGAAVIPVETRTGSAGRLLGRSLGSRLRRALARRPDLVLSYKAPELEPGLIEALRPRSRAVWVNWFPDSPHVLDLSLAIGAAYDRCFLFDSYMVARHRSLGRPAEFLPLGFDPELFRPVPDGARPELPIVFVGSPEPFRDRALGRVADLGLALYGPERAGGPLFGERLARVSSRASIGLNVHQFFGEDPAAGRYGTGANQRVFELAGIGRVQLCDAKADIARSFVEDQEIVLFRTGEELRDKAVALLADPSRRAAIGARARERALREHTWAHRVRELVDRVFR